MSTSGVAEPARQTRQPPDQSQEQTVKTLFPFCPNEIKHYLTPRHDSAITFISSYALL